MQKKLQIIKLKGGAEVLVDWSIPKKECKACGVSIQWAKTKSGKMMPINVCGAFEWEPHWASCKFADKFRKKRKDIPAECNPIRPKTFNNNADKFAKIYNCTKRD
jgi:hypothetical protein